jgi:hypothetical protein
LQRLFCCGKNKESEKHELEQKSEPHFEETTPSELPKNDSIYQSPEDSKRGVKHSILRKQK